MRITRNGSRSRPIDTSPRLATGSRDPPMHRLRATQVRFTKTHELRRQIATVFTGVDLVITPTVPRPAAPLAQSNIFAAVGLRNTSPFNVLGLPTISVPCGFTTSGLPIGLQISGAPFAEPTVLALAHAFEQATEWHKRRPALPAA